VPFDVQALLRNKPALIGIGVAGAAGLYVLLRRKQTTGSTAASPDTTTGATTGTGFPDTTGTDVAAWLGTQSGQLAAQQQQFLQQLQQQAAGGGPAAIPPTPPTGTMPTTPAYPRIPIFPGKTAIRPVKPVTRPSSGF
jgi:hypothetical protein